jgi:hypothetical protein
MDDSDAYFSELWFGFFSFFCWIFLLKPQNQNNQALAYNAPTSGIVSFQFHHKSNYPSDYFWFCCISLNVMMMSFSGLESEVNLVRDLGA